MKLLKKINFHSVHKWLLISLFLFPILPLKVSAIQLILNLLFAAYLFVVKFKSKSLQKSKIPIAALFLSSLSIVYFVFFFFSDFPSVAWFHFEKRMALIVAPLLFFLLHKSGFKLPLQLILKSYAISGIILSILSIAAFIYGAVVFGISSDNFAYQVRTLSENITMQHPTYLGLHIFSSFFVLIYLFKNCTSQFHKNFIVLFSIVLLFGGILSGARSPLIATIFAGLFFVFNQKDYSKNLKWSSLILALIIPLVLIQIPIIGERFHGILNAIKLNFSDPNAVDSMQRFWVYWCDFGIIKNTWFAGVGTGEVQNHLNLCYQMIDANLALKLELNTHNEYANIWIGTGIIGIFLFLGFLISTWLQIKHWLPKIFLILFAMVCLTENLLERQQGVFFAGLLFSLFIFNGLAPCHTSKCKLPD